MPRLLDIKGIEQVVAEARAVFEPILSRLSDRRQGRHPLPRLIRRIEDNVIALRAGASDVDVRAILSLHRATSGFSVWARDPSSVRIFQESSQPETFDHNTALLQVASMLESSQLGPELVPPREGRTADLALRVSASRSVDLDIKTPRALRFPESGSIRIVEPRETIKKALRGSRGQFGEHGLLVIAGEIWFGGIDAYADAAAKLLREPLAEQASPEARAHYRQLLGLIFAGTGYEEDGRNFRPASFMRWVKSPRYEGDIALDLPADLDGPFSIAFWPGPKATNPAARHASVRQSRHPVPDTAARFRRVGDEVEVDGVVNRQPASQPGRLVICTFDEGYRPLHETDVDVACETGFTVVTARTDGSMLADPSVGWIDLRGLRFRGA